MPPGPAPKVVEVQGTEGMFYVVRDGLERDLAEKRARRLFGLGPEVGMSGKQTLENGMGFTGFEPFENRARLR